jgi:predicted nucleotidyltransferase
VNPARFGLSQRDLRLIIEQISAYPQIERALLFGSRALGNYKPGSDCDIALTGPLLTTDIIHQLRSRLNEQLPLPYMFDIVDATHVTNASLIDHIREFGIEIFSR